MYIRNFYLQVQNFFVTVTSLHIYPEFYLRNLSQNFLSPKFVSEFFVYLYIYPEFYLRNLSQNCSVTYISGIFISELFVQNFLSQNCLVTYLSGVLSQKFVSELFGYLYIWNFYLRIICSELFVQNFLSQNFFS